MFRILPEIISIIIIIVLVYSNFLIPNQICNQIPAIMSYSNVLYMIFLIVLFYIFLDMVIAIGEK